MVKTSLDLIRQLFKLRTCTYNLTEANISAGKFKACLEFYIGNCKAPCIGSQTESDYSESISQIRYILKGNILTVTGHLKEKMTEFSRELRFEEAQILKEKIDTLTKFRSRSAVVSNTIQNVDVFAFTQDNDRCYVNYLKVVEGAVVQAFTLK
jgi:excinuclease ABC subunit C